MDTVNSPSRATGIPAGHKASPRTGSPNHPLYSLGCVVVGLVLLSHAVFAQSNDNVRRVKSVEHKAASEGALLVRNLIAKRTFRGKEKLKGETWAVSQAYSDNSQSTYLLTDITLRIPSAHLGIQNQDDAKRAKFVISYTHPKEKTPYADCTLEARWMDETKVIYSYGLKDTGREPLMRWGNCDNPQSPGYDSVVPATKGRDKAALKDANGQIIARFTPVSARQSLSIPKNAKPKAKPAIAELMESAPYQIGR
jgi:hypothetical protein